jgi:hypothetical protein
MTERPVRQLKVTSLPGWAEPYLPTLESFDNEAWKEVLEKFSVLEAALGPQIKQVWLHFLKFFCVSHLFA